MEYVVLENAITGCQEFVSTAGVEQSTIGCVWKSTDAYACITDCADCSLGMINSSATQLGYTASASNSSTAIGLGATACCTSTAIGNGASAVGANEIHIKGGCSEITNKCNCINISNEGSTAIDVSNTALNVGSDSNTYLNVACDCIDVKGCTAVVNVGANSVAIGANATATCGIDIRGANAEVKLADRQISIGYCINSSDECGIVAGNNINVCSDLFNTVVGSNISIGCDLVGGTNVIIGYEHRLVNCAYNDLTVIGSFIDEQGIDFKGCINDRDVILGSADSAFQLCASNGYLYSAGGSCLMTGRILPSSSCLPVSNCSLIMYYVP